MSDRDYYYAANRWASGLEEAPSRHGRAWLLPAQIKSGMAASLHNGRVHLVREAAISTDGDRSRLMARWICGPGSANVRPAETDEVACEWCERLQALPNVTIAVYRCFDVDGELLYIGSTVNLRSRIKQHYYQAPWWDNVSRVDAEPHDTIEAARYAEAVAIAAESPMMNKVGKTLRVIDGGAA